ncbi:MAG: ThuA domain-containing protein [Gemmatimonas sp.]|nr:ThuA domain-containing protein [Gemmatimonas sp.]
MRTPRFLGVIGALVMLAGCDRAPAGPARLLVFSKTAGYRHESIDSGKVALMRLAQANGMQADTTEDASRITEASLEQYAAVVFLSTTENVLNREQEIDLQRYIQTGGGYVGIHAAADAEYDWAWYGRLVGAYFKSHPEQQDATLRVARRDDP